MARRSSRAVYVLAALATLGVASAYGCGGGGSESPSPSPGETATVDGGGTVLEDGAMVLPDGAVVPSDAAAAKDAASDGASAGDASMDANEAGVDAYVPPAGPLSPDYVDYDVNHVIMTGQSNALANTSTAPRVTTAYANLMFLGGPTVGATPTSFVPLAAGDGGWAASGMADRITKFALETFEFGVKAGYPTKHDVLVSNNARSGWTYWCLRKGGCTYKAPPVPFADAMGHVMQGKALAAADGKSYVVRAVTSIHGESEHTSYVAGTPEFPLAPTDPAYGQIKDYADALVEWQRDYENEVKALTGQAEAVPFFITQLSGWNDVRYSPVPQFQYLAHKRAPGKVVIIGASYPMQFFSDCRHFTGESRRKLGEYFAKAYAKMVFEGKPWEPVRPQTITRAGNVITVKFIVPVPPLAFDTTRVPFIDNYGFDFVENGTLAPITSVSIVSPDTVQITLAAAPGAGTKKLRYAQNQVPFTCQGIGSNDGKPAGARGNLRDSDGTVSRYGFDLHNWAIVFEEDVP